MAYIDTNTVKLIREKIKREFPKYKFSVTREHHSTVMVRIMAGPLDLGTAYSQLNTYYLERIEHQVLREMTQKIEAIITGVRAPEYRETGDYGTQPDYYSSIHVGRWDKPYQVLGGTK